MKKNWQYIFLIFSTVFLVWGLYDYFHTHTQIQHFREGVVTMEKDIPTEMLYLIEGQYKTEGEEFVVGEKVTIWAKIFFNKNAFQTIKKLYENPNIPKKIFILNSEKVEDSKKDLSKHLAQEFWNITPGELDVVEINTEKRTFIIKGDVIFTKEGKLSFVESDTAASDPIVHFLKQYKADKIGVYIAPRYVRQQIRTNKLTELLSFITIAIAFLALFFSFNAK